MSEKKLFKDGCVITLDKTLGDFKKADVLVEGSKIVEVRPRIEVGSDFEVIDASNMIVMPGFVDTHRHTWESVIRNVGADWSLMKYLNSIYFGNIGAKLRPEDGYVANLLGALEALDAGVTTILDWSMIISPDHAYELIRGLQESGIRAVFAYGIPGDGDYWSRESQIRHSEDSRRVKNSYFSSDDQLLTMALAIRGPEFSSWDTAVDDIQLARELDVLCSMHLGFGSWGSVDRSIEKLQQADLLGPDLNFVHANSISPEEFKMVADAGASISVTPEVEMMMGHGYPPTGLILENGGRPALGVDVVTSTGGDMFAQMKFALQAERARINDKVLAEGKMPEKLNLTAREVLEFAITEGARVLKLDHKIGTLSPGKEADIIMIRTTDLNLYPVNDPIGAVVQCAHAGNVDSVFVAGQAVKRDGKMLKENMDRIFGLAKEARDHIFAKYGNPDGLWLL
ncbi:cytosine/adenosine deaminase-related metal-dependent hydrolase [Caldalkalibacillus uzonensis]|uniref:Cytosine/adenosine deaminase-related metal-dependent hydrolase n=1 Tax=Caldalkalibacillus uzonensis TaxID=353224 RepID=A0ABU0CPM2_9BACI|nr:amidohydrolase family protein [Caldalkalibacillus uzonensis]MDQ0338361.1 cytosine/adenosine deaminase-related metal-dependent hydrolase [Caldalkalibacillus uzonensis]